jgi:hypothetical protein
MLTNFAESWHACLWPRNPRKDRKKILMGIGSFHVFP